jgi:hypothetical protein
VGGAISLQWNDKFPALALLYLLFHCSWSFLYQAAGCTDPPKNCKDIWC